MFPSSFLRLGYGRDTGAIADDRIYPDGGKINYWARDGRGCRRMTERAAGEPEARSSFADAAR